MDATTILHLSDVHLSRPPGGLRLLGRPKRLLAWLSWTLKKKRRQDPAVLKAMRAEVASQGPDLVVLTGDMTQTGDPDEFQQAQAWLQGLGRCESVFLVPGNHDATVAGLEDSAFEAWAPWFASDEGHEAEQGHFPSLRVRGSVAVVGLSTAVPTGLGRASGFIGDAQLRALEPLLERLGRQGLTRVIALHHPPAAGVVSARKALIDRAALEAVLERKGCELILHGHGHRPEVRSMSLRGAEVPSLGVSALAEAKARHLGGGRYHHLTITEGRTLSMAVRSWSLKSGEFATIEERTFALPDPRRD